MPLTEAAIKAAKPREKPFKLSDEKGLFLLVNPSGSKLWRIKYRIAGKEQLLALGAYPDVTLKQARARRDESRSIIHNGRNPSAERKAAKQRQMLEAKNSFKAVALDFIAKAGKHWTERHRTIAMRRLEANVFPVLGNRPIAQIEPPELLEVLRKIEDRSAHETAGRVRTLCSQVFRYGISCGMCSRDAAADLRGALTPPKSSHMPVIPLEELPALLQAIDQSEEAPACRDRQTRLAMQFLALTFVRTGELRKALWSQVSWEDGIWMPAIETMKTRRPHIVPLAPQAVAALEELYEITGSGRCMFPGEGKKGIMSENTILYGLYALGYRGRMSGHGFRSLASTVLNEAGFDSDMIELQLAHVDKNAVRRAYNHAKYLDSRREMMAWYGNYLDKLRKGEFVKPHLFRREASGAAASL
ncbi:MAG: integrase arm-type DNA-binding domain-containing protein [Rhodomicrobium sp.]